jgi:hypothetical protein
MNSKSSSISNNPDDVPTMPADKTLRRRQAKSNKLAISGLFGISFFNLLICCLLLLNLVQTIQGKQEDKGNSFIIISSNEDYSPFYRHSPTEFSRGHNNPIPTPPATNLLSGIHKN